MRSARPTRRSACCGCTGPALYRSVDDVGAAGERRADALRRLDRPALVLWGRHDPYIGVQHAERERRAFPHADVRVLDRAGHWPFVDQPNEVAAALTDFLARHAATRAHAEATALTAADAGRDGTT
jgi:pimeloyl-ACP methyl ester carboxylesterase